MWPMWPVDYDSDTLIVPCVRTRCDKQRLAGLKGFVSWCVWERKVVNLQQWVLNKLSSLARNHLQVVSPSCSILAGACEIGRCK
jgi:hypothetical protein